SDEELRRLLARVEAHQTRDARCTIAAPTFRALLLLLYGTGLRLGEALALRREDVDLRAGMILTRDGKIHKSRHLPHAPRLAHARIACTQRYLTMIPELLEQASLRFETYARGEVGHA